MVFLFMGIFAAWAPRILDTTLGVSRYISERSNADAHIIGWAEQASARVASIHASNRKLQQLQARCLRGDGAIPPRHALITSAGATVYADQLLEQARLDNLLLEMNSQGTLTPTTGLREPIGPCEVPGILRLGLSETLVSFREPHAGFDLKSRDPYSQPSWQFAHDGVLPL